MNDNLRFHALQWIRVNTDTIAACDVEEFIDTTRNYFKTIWADGYTEIIPIHAFCTGQNAKKPKTLASLSVYKSPKLRYNINVRNER
jgi:hypothetical protein